MALVEMVMPKMGESIMEATVLSWLKEEGDSIEQDESVLEVATDKVDTEVPAIHAGVLKEKLAQDGDVVEVGKPIAIIETEGEGGGDTSSSAPAKKEAPQASEKTAAADKAPAKEAVIASDRFYSPLVLNIARKEGIAMSELESVPGSGREGRVTKKDILAYVKDRGSKPAGKSDVSEKIAPAYTPSRSTGQDRAPQPAAVSVGGADEIIEMDRMRKMIADRMVDSKRISPHVTSFVEADVTNIVRWRNKHKNSFKERHGASLTFTPIFIEAVVNAIKDYPMINVQVDGNRIIKKKDINIGLAVALPSGNLIVPVIHNADQLNITGLALRVNDMAKRARDNKLKPDELGGGTFTVSNV
ncbi:MAG: dihydrolipoamide acetyltransferase family protein, partial [Cyclobacteriaceae bacterium]